MVRFLGLPEVASAHGVSIDRFISYVHWLMILLFVGWLMYFVYVLWRFQQRRQPRPDPAGARSHVSTYAEIGVATVEGLLLIFLAVPIWAHVSEQFPAEEEATVVHVMAQQFNWNFRYAGPDGRLGRQDPRFVSETNLFGIDPADPAGRDDVTSLNEMHVPVGKPVIVHVSSKDVIHSFKIPSMRLTQDAIPGMRVPTHFTPTREGRYRIYCAQLCGNGHAAMAQGVLVVESPASFEQWLQSRSGGSVSYE
ncbi:MAG: cytochrome c oxidase subunit II [Verrucomicrobiota bacterium]|nr:cytochrome c oxidase subunit II [Limisphaera sp.]MDW8381666.1 cytochrome c oxidase subunit II [Verrucomicrobiota bacterium]